MSMTDRWGRTASIAAMLGVLGYGTVQVLQLLRAIAPPWDEAAIYAVSICIAPPFMVAIQALHRATPPERRLASGVAAAFATAYMVFALLIYGVQLGAYIPYLASDPGTGVLRVTPHSLFWTVDALAYLSMGAAALFAALALPRDPEDRALRGWLLAHAAMTPVIGAVYFAPRFGTALLLLASPWLVTASVSLWLLARRFGRTA